MSLISIFKKKNNKVLFTTPSHNGNISLFHKFYNWYKYDISETDTHNPQESLIKAEKNASKIYGTKYTKFLTNGSTSGVIAAILASGGKYIAIWENAHQCHKNGCILAGAKIYEYKLDKDNNLGLYKAIKPNAVIDIINKNIDTIIITSPTYEGYVSDIKTISEICRKAGVKLIVDEAHGALYPFSDNLPQSAVKYADYTVQSLHKTAGGINPTALLHSNDNNPAMALEMINTTSPSYPMLATIEKNIKFLNSKRGKRHINELIDNIKTLHLPQFNDDITKIILKKKGLSGYELSDILYNKYNIEDERTNDKTTMLLCGLGTTKKMLQKLKKALNSLGL